MKKLITIVLVSSISVFAQMKISHEAENFIDSKQPAVLSKKIENRVKFFYKVDQENKTFKLKNFNSKALESYTEYTPTTTMNVGSKASIIYDETTIRNLATKAANELLPSEIAKNIGITNVAFDIESYSINPLADKVTGVSVSFHRIIDGTSIRDDAYVDMDIDSLANVTEIRIKWPTYSKVPVVRNPKKTNTIALHKEMRSNYLSEFNEKHIRKGNVVNGEFNKAFSTLKTISLDNGTKVLIPYITYVGEISVNGDKGFVQMDVIEDDSDIPEGTTIVMNK